MNILSRYLLLGMIGVTVGTQGAVDLEKIRADFAGFWRNLSYARIYFDDDNGLISLQDMYPDEEQIADPVVDSGEKIELSSTVPAVDPVLVEPVVVEDTQPVSVEPPVVNEGIVTWLKENPVGIVALLVGGITAAALVCAVSNGEPVLFFG